MSEVPLLQPATPPTGGGEGERLALWDNYGEIGWVPWGHDSALTSFLSRGGPICPEPGVHRLLAIKDTHHPRVLQLG